MGASKSIWPPKTGQVLCGRPCAQGYAAACPGCPYLTDKDQTVLRCTSTRARRGPIPNLHVQGEGSRDRSWQWRHLLWAAISGSRHPCPKSLECHIQKAILAQRLCPASASHHGTYVTSPPGASVASLGLKLLLEER